MGFMYYAKLNTLQLLEAVPPDPLFQRYNPGVSPSPQQILDLPLRVALLALALV